MRRLFNAAGGTMVAALALLSVGCPSNSAPAGGQIVNEQGYNQITARGITFQWKIVGTSLEAIVSAQTSGWVAVGFGPSSMMMDANVIIAHVLDGVAEARDDFGVTATSHASDLSLGGTSDVSAVSGSETGGTTEIAFTIPLDSGDAYDKPLVQGSACHLILATSTSDGFDYFHSVAAGVDVTL
jgi:hypothetical protein